MEVIFLVYFPFVFLVLYVATNHLLHKLQNLPPAPFLSLPLLGHLYMVKKPLHQTLSRISDKYGSLVFLRFGSRPVLLVSSPSVVAECFTKNDFIFANRPRLLAGKYFGYNYTNIAFSPYGDHWRNLRRIASLELLSAHRLQMLSQVRASEVQNIIYHLSRAVMDYGPDHHVEIKPILSEATFNVMTKMMAGKRYYGRDGGSAVSEEVKRCEDMVRETFRLGGKANLGDFIPLLRWLGLDQGLAKEFMGLQAKREEFMQHLIEEIKSDGDSDCEATKKTMFHILLSLQKTEPDYYTDQTVISLLLALFTAGTDTSVATMEWAMSHLLNDQEILKKAKKEIDESVGDDRLIDESDLSRLPYLNSIIKETLRMHPAIPMSLPHESSERCTVAGYHVPRGTMLLVNLWAIQNDPKLWVEPKKFRPERFNLLEAEYKLDDFKFIPFGAGRRGCPGENLAMRMVGLTLGLLLQCFDWERVSEEMVDMTEAVTVSLFRAKPLKAKCRPRASVVRLLTQV